MLGWINDCIEKLVVSKYDAKTWHIVKQKAGCTVADGDFLKLEHYTDKSTIDLVVAVSEVAGLTVDQVLEAFGAFFVPYIIDEGYENLLCCQGSTMKDWMTNINAIHSHLQTTFPKKMIMPEFWCEENMDGTLTLYYHSQRGNLLAPLAVGLVSEVAHRQFELDLVFDKLTTQDVDGAQFTSWKITTKNPQDIWKLTQKKGMRNGVENDPTSFKCPFTGMSATIPADHLSSFSHKGMPYVFDTDDNKTAADSSDDAEDASTGNVRPCTRDSQSICHASVVPRRASLGARSLDSSGGSIGFDTPPPGSLSAETTRKLFPYHVMINYEFEITQVGKKLSRLVNKDGEVSLIGSPLSQVLQISKPMDADWSWDWLRKLEDQSFTVELNNDDAEDWTSLRFSATVVLTSEYRVEAMLILSPDANSLDDLREMRLTLSDLPSHGAYRDAVFLREHLSTQMNNALKMEKLSRTLEREKALLEELLPEHAAEGLRSGRAVEPMIHPNVTMFFSDIVGFTTICNKLYPWEVIAMLNRLYSVMDFLAKKFNLFKVETIGDAYVCCSGLPNADQDHARNVANFAVAVQHCSQLLKSPVDGTPIELRIGVHTGPCASGVVGVTNPRYCVFGDTVNTTARHESTGEPGKIHCSRVCQMELMQSAGDSFSFKDRGMIEMKGKGKLRTFFLEASATNKLVNRCGLFSLQEEVRQILDSTSSFGTEDATNHLDSKTFERQNGAELFRTNGSSASLLAGENDMKKGKSLPGNAPTAEIVFETPRAEKLVTRRDSSSLRTNSTCTMDSSSSVGYTYNLATPSTSPLTSPSAEPDGKSCPRPSSRRHTIMAGQISISQMYFI